MKFLKATDVFESSSCCYFVSKFCFFYFATYEKSKNGFYISKTRFFDVILYVGYMIFGIYWTLDLLRTPTASLKSRSVILEICVDLKSKILLFQPFTLLTIAFLNRHTILDILQKLDRIDKIVNKF